MNIEKYLRTVQNFPHEGIGFKDVSPLLANPKGFSQAIDALLEMRDPSTYDSIGVFDSRGFLFGPTMAYVAEKPFFMLRKKGKLPYETIEETYGLEYGTDTLEVHTDAVQQGDRVLLIDDILATGGTMKAGATLVERLGGTVVGCDVLLELPGLGGREKLKGYDTRARNLEYCTDVIALYENKLVLVERLTAPYGLALPGGRRDYHTTGLESVNECGIREMSEETGLRLNIESELGVYDDPTRDPRGHKISNVVVGYATGQIVNEENHTKVRLVDPSHIHEMKNEFVFDHYTILCDWLAQN